MIFEILTITLLIIGTNALAVLFSFFNNYILPIIKMCLPILKPVFDTIFKFLNSVYEYSKPVIKKTINTLTNILKGIFIEFKKIAFNRIKVTTNIYALNHQNKLEHQINSKIINSNELPIEILNNMKNDVIRYNYKNDLIRLVNNHLDK